MSQPDYICNVLTRMSSCRVFLSFFFVILFHFIYCRCIFLFLLLN
jgi:hypothetical protein